MKYIILFLLILSSTIVFSATPIPHIVLPTSVNNRSGNNFNMSINQTNYINQFDQSLNTTDDVTFNSVSAPNICYSDGSNCLSIGGNPFNQSLNTSDDVNFNSVTAPNLCYSDGSNCASSGNSSVSNDSVFTYSNQSVCQGLLVNGCADVTDMTVCNAYTDTCYWHDGFCNEAWISSNYLCNRFLVGDCPITTTSGDCYISTENIVSTKDYNSTPIRILVNGAVDNNASELQIKGNVGGIPQGQMNIGSMENASTYSPSIYSFNLNGEYVPIFIPLTQVYSIGFPTGSISSSLDDYLTHFQSNSGFAIDIGNNDDRITNFNGNGVEMYSKTLDGGGDSPYTMDFVSVVNGAKARLAYYGDANEVLLDPNYQGSNIFRVGGDTYIEDRRNLSNILNNGDFNGNADYWDLGIGWTYSDSDHTIKYQCSYSNCSGTGMNQTTSNMSSPVIAGKTYLISADGFDSGFGYNLRLNVGGVNLTGYATNNHNFHVFYIFTALTNDSLNIKSSGYSLHFTNISLAPLEKGDLYVRGTTTVNKINSFDGYYYDNIEGVTSTFNTGSDTQIAFNGGIATAISTAYDESLMDNINYLADADNSQFLIPISFQWNELGLKQFADNGESEKGIYTGYKAQDVALFYPDCILNEKRKEMVNINNPKSSIVLNTTIIIIANSSAFNITYQNISGKMQKVKTLKDNVYFNKTDNKYYQFTINYGIKTENITTIIQNTTKDDVLNYNRFCVENHLLADRLNSTYSNQIEANQVIAKDFLFSSEPLSRAKLNGQTSLSALSSTVAESLNKDGTLNDEKTFGAVLVNGVWKDSAEQEIRLVQSATLSILSCDIYKDDCNIECHKNSKGFDEWNKCSLECDIAHKDCLER